MVGGLMRRFGDQSGDIPNAFGRAERAMRDAIESLDRGDTGQAVEPQSEALDQLQQAGRSMMGELARQMGMGEPGREQAGEPGPRFDPQIGRVSCRERVWRYGQVSLVAVHLKKKPQTAQHTT